MSARLRQVFVALRLRWFGRVAPREVIRAFGVSRATASAEVAALRACVPGARHDSRDGATVATPQQAACIAGDVAPNGRAALELIFAQKRLVDAGGGMRAWSNIPLEDRTFFEDPIDDEVVRVLIAGLEAGWALGLSGKDVPALVTPVGLVRARGRFRVRAIDHAARQAVEVDLSDIRVAWRSAALPMADPGDMTPEAWNDMLVLFTDTTITVPSTAGQAEAGPAVAAVNDDSVPAAGYGDQPGKARPCSPGVGAGSLEARKRARSSS